MLASLFERLVATPCSRLSQDVELVIPVCNAANWLDLVAQYHTDLGLDPLYVVEARSKDKSLAILRHHGARVHIHSGAHPRVESLLFDFIPTIKKKWVLRLDDDEVASPVLIRWINTHLDSLNHSAIGLPRRSVALRDTGKKHPAVLGTRCTKAGGEWGPDRQFRLFRPDVVVMDDAIHTCGFVLPRHTEAPGDATLYHFDWIVRTYQQRKAKIAGYKDQQTTMEMDGYYLPEDQEPDFYDFSPIQDKRIASLAQMLDQRRAWLVASGAIS